MSFLIPSASFGQAGPVSFSLSGTLYNSSGDTITQSGVNFKIEILDKNATCVLYSELHSNEDLSHTKGGFALEIGKGTSIQNFLEGTTALSSKIFENNGATGAFSGCTGVTLSNADQRLIRISYDIGSGLVAMTPNVPMDAANYSTVAETLQGKRPADFLQVHNDNSTVFLSQSNLEYPYSATNWPKFQALLNGTSSQYIPSVPGSTVSLNGQTLTNIATPVAGTDAANKNYVDGSVGGKSADLTGVGPAAGDGDTLVWDQAANKWKVGTPSVTDNTKLPLAGGTMTGPITMGGFDLYNTGHITLGSQRLLNLGTFTTVQENALSLAAADKGKILYNTDLGQIRVWNGSSFSGLTSPVTSVNGKTGAVSLNVMDIYLAGTAALYDVGVAANNVVQLDTNAHLPAVDGSALTNINGAALTNVNAVRIQSRAIAATAPTDGQVLKWNNATSQWEPGADSTGIGTITQVVAGTGSTGGGSSGVVTVGVDVGITANKIVQLDSNAFLPAVDGNKLTNLNAVRIQGQPVSATGPSNGQVLQYNSTTTQWEPVAIPSSPVTSVAGKTGAVTIDVADLQSGTGKYFTYQPNGTACATGEILKWNSSRWECAADSSSTGDITDVNAGNGLLGGGTSGSVTVSVDTGVTANKIVQLDSNAFLPAVDGNLLTNLNAIRLQARAVSNANPSSGQVLTWNGTTSVWEPQTSVATSTINAIVAGTGATGGGSTGSVTVGVDVGVSANKIVQLDSNAFLPALDGNLLTNLNAIRLQSRAVANVTPNDTEVLTWNATTSQWEPHAAATTGITALTGDVIASGTGSVTATIAVNAITSAKINNTGNTQNRLLITDAVTGTTVTYATCSLNQILKWNATGWECAADDAGTSTYIGAGTGLTGGPITSSGTLAVDVGVTANKIVQLDSNAFLPAVDGNQLTNLSAARLQNFPVATTPPTAGKILGWNDTLAAWEPTTPSSGTISQVTAGTGATGGGSSGNVTIGVDVGVSANQIVQLTSNAFLPAVDGNLLTNLNASRIGTRTVASTLPTANQVLTWNNSTSQWEPQTSVATSTIASIVAGTGATGGGSTGTVTVGVDVGVSANKIVQLDSNAFLPAVDGNQLTNLSAARLQNFPVATTPPTAGKILGWNDTLAAWEPTSIALNSGTVTDVEVGTGLTGGPITSSGTLAVDVGVTANKIVQLDSNAFLPAVDGNKLTNVNASRIGTHAMASTLPTANQVLTWNNSTSQWEPQTSVASSTISSVTAGTGATGGGSTGDITLGVDVGVTANKVVQLDSNAFLPAVDGNKLTNVNAVRLQGFPLASTTPTTGNFIGWNSSTSRWEPMNASVSGLITQITAGTGATGGGSSGEVTLGVDVGVTANKVVQLDSNAFLPAVDGNQLTNVSASRLSGNAVKSGTPSANQVLTWNGTSAQWEAQTSATAPWTVLNSNVYYTGGNVGVGTTNPSSSIDVVKNQSAFTEVSITNTSSNSAAAAGVVLESDSVTLTAQALSSTGGDYGGLNSSGDMWLTASGIIQFKSGWNNSLYLGSDGRVSVMSGSTAATGAALDVAGTGTSASSMIVPRDTVGHRPTSAVNGMIRYNTSYNKFEVYENGNWTPVQTGTGAVGTITQITAGTGATGGGTSGNVTLGVDVGVTANKIVQLDSNAFLPAVDGNKLTNISAARLQGYSIANTAPTSGKVLTWNGTTGQWEPQSTAVTGVSYVGTGTGLTGGPISSTGTLAVDVGTSANKIVQLDSNAFLPAVDGNKLTNVNASRIGTRAIASTAPSGGQVLLWNATTSQWEPQAVPVATTAWVNGGNSFGANSAIGNNDNFDLGFETNGSTRMTIAKAGSVGIGTTAPAAPLSVLGNGINATGTMYVVAGFDNAASTKGVWLGYDSSGTIGLIGSDTAGGASSLAFVTVNSSNALTEKMRIDGSGNVGVGTTSPGAAIDVVGAANTSTGYKVNGTAVVDSNGFVIPAQATAGGGCTTVGSVARDASGNLLVCQ